MNKVKLRFYLLHENKLIKIGRDSYKSRRFPALANNIAMLLQVVYLNSDNPFILKIWLSNIYFDDNGKWDIYPMERVKAANAMNDLFDNNYKDENKIAHLIPKPKLSPKQKDMLKKRITKDFGIQFWNEMFVLLKKDKLLK